MSRKYRNVDVNSQVTDDYRHYRGEKLQMINLVSCKKGFTQPHSLTIHVFLHARVEFSRRIGHLKTIPILEIRLHRLCLK